eukprot:COSAG02_NODE_1239_length_13713_cov_37.434259_11_plen_280_part_00
MLELPPLTNVAPHRIDAAEFVERLAHSSMAHKARVAGRSRRHARNRAARALYDEGDEDAARDALLLEEELEKLDDGLWDAKVKKRAGRQRGDQHQVDRRRWHHERLERQMIRDERSDPAFRRPRRSTAWADNQLREHNPSCRLATSAIDRNASAPMDSADLRQRPDAGAYKSNSWVGVVGSGAYWVGSEPSAQAELLALRHSIEVQQTHAHQMLQELQARQIVESELEWQLMQRQEQQIGPMIYPSTPDAYHVSEGRAAAAWPELPFDNETEPYPLDSF